MGLTDNCVEKKQMIVEIPTEQPSECIFGYGVCGYPIDDCKNCPARPDNNDPYWNMSSCEIK